MAGPYLIGLDFGSESARGVLIDSANGRAVASCVHPYKHGVITQSLPDGQSLPHAWALQDATDYIESAEIILSELGKERDIASIGVDFTASSPMPATAAGTPLSVLRPHDPHAYVKLWKHVAAQAYADAINAKGGSFLDRFGGRLSGEWLLAKAAQIASEAPETWAMTDRFIEAGDWLVWQLSGVEARSLGFAAYKAQYSAEAGYPADRVPGLASKLAPPLVIGSPAGGLSEEWRRRTGITGKAIVAVAVIDSHAVLPAVNGVSSGTFVGALGTSAAYLFLNDVFRPLPRGLEGVARDGAIRGLWLYEAGQASFGDTLAWFVRTFPRAPNRKESFRFYNEAAAATRPGDNHLMGIDWWNGNRVPLADSRLSGLLLGLTRDTTAADIYRALLESLCFGAKWVVDLIEAADFAIDRIVMTSGLAEKNPLIVQIMADVLERPIEVPVIGNSTAVGAAIHGAVAAEIVTDYREGAARYGAKKVQSFLPNKTDSRIYQFLYGQYRELGSSKEVRSVMHNINEISVCADA